MRCCFFRRAIRTGRCVAAATERSGRRRHAEKRASRSDQALLRDGITREPENRMLRMNVRVYSTLQMISTFFHQFKWQALRNALPLLAISIAMGSIRNSAVANTNSIVFLFPLELPVAGGNEADRPVTRVGSGPHNLRVWSEPTHPNNLNVLLGGLQDDETSALITMIDLKGNTIADQHIAAQAGFLNIQLTANEPLPKGTYLLTLRTIVRSWTERIVVE